MHGGALHAPPGARLRSLDLAAARALAGVTVVHEGEFVGVAAPDPETCARALEAVEVEWELPEGPGDRELAGYLLSHPIELEGWGGSFHHEAGDVGRALTEAEVTLTATYTTAYLAHVPLETRAALAEWEGERLTVWTGTQRPFGVRAQLAQELGLPEERVRVLAPTAGGGFGGKHTGEAALEAARLARAVQAPVKVRWSREQEFSCGLRAAGRRDRGAERRRRRRNDHRVAVPRTSTRAPPGSSARTRSRTSEISFQPADSPLRQGSYRALAATANHFARESQLDELAHHLGVDPVELRLRHLEDERLAAVLRAAAERRAGTSNRVRAAPGSGSPAASRRTAASPPARQCASSPTGAFTSRASSPPSNAARSSMPATSRTRSRARS